MSTHRPFETWILQGEPLRPQDDESLRRHLQGCQACRSLAQGWGVVEPRLSSVTLAAPRPGFVRRWESRKAVRRAGRRSDWWMLAANLIAATVAAVVVLWEVGSGLDGPTALLNDWIRDFALWSVAVRVGGDILRALANSLPSGLLGGMWLGFVAAMGCLTVLWVASFYRITVQGASS